MAGEEISSLKTLRSLRTRNFAKGGDMVRGGIYCQSKVGQSQVTCFPSFV